MNKSSTQREREGEGNKVKMLTLKAKDCMIPLIEVNIIIKDKNAVE